jgi:peroxiredoxin
MNIGDKAPDFELPDTELKMRSLKEFSGKPLVLAFFPGAFTSVCQAELCTFRDSLARFNKFNAAVVGISVDHPFSQQAFKTQNNLNFPLLSDFNKEVTAKYGGLHENFAGIKGLRVAKRSVFVVDKEGKIAYKWVSENPGKEPDYKAVEEEVAKLR